MSDTEITPEPITLPILNLGALERAAMAQALEKNNGNRTHAAKDLGCDVRTLQRGIRRYGLASAATCPATQKST